MQAIQNIQSKKFVKALDFISKARQFPDNLGSGKPYEEDIDYRVEDFLTALSYEKSNKKEDAANFFGKVAAYSKPGLKSNMIAQVWALQKLGERNAADRLAEKILSTEKNDSLKVWMMALLNDKETNNPVPGKSDNNMLLLESIGKLIR